MPRDIDLIIERLSADVPAIQIRQLQVLHPGNDDDGLWFFALSGRSEEVQLESSEGCCPFLVESDYNNDRAQAGSIEEAIALVKRLHGLT